MEQIWLMSFPVAWEMLASGDMEIIFPLQWAPPSHMAELQALHWQQAECMETQAKSFIADRTKCHHFRHGFAQCWEIMEVVLRFLDCHHPLPLLAARVFPGTIPIIPISHCAHLADASWGAPLMSCQAQCPGVQMAFGFLSPSGGRN